ncbi:hypothetical protein PR048_013215 [Dryococelus australis]|uniref:Uncharacterized protein n=1 Tax=Dryococelus australis TaxID=614101 RepID=A0ABQ9HSE4_9NEOP|nr:hypothetical protein PR048_013215 [Dryococelus australis]
MEVLEHKAEYENLKSFVKLILIIGFLVNRECFVVNLKEQSLVVQHIIYDSVTAKCGLDNIKIPRSVVFAMRNAKERKRVGLEIRELEIKKREFMEDKEKELAYISANIIDGRQRCSPVTTLLRLRVLRDAVGSVCSSHLSCLTLPVILYGLPRGRGRVDLPWLPTGFTQAEVLCMPTCDAWMSFRCRICDGWRLPQCRVCGGWMLLRCRACSSMITAVGDPSKEVDSAVGVTPEEVDGNAAAVAGIPSKETDGTVPTSALNNSMQALIYHIDRAADLANVMSSGSKSSPARRPDSYKITWWSKQCDGECHTAILNHDKRTSYACSESAATTTTIRESTIFEEKYHNFTCTTCSAATLIQRHPHHLILLSHACVFIVTTHVVTQGKKEPGIRKKPDGTLVSAKELPFSDHAIRNDAHPGQESTPVCTHKQRNYREENKLVQEYLSLEKIPEIEQLDNITEPPLENKQSLQLTRRKFESEIGRDIVHERKMNQELQEMRIATQDMNSTNHRTHCDFCCTIGISPEGSGKCQMALLPLPQSHGRSPPDRFSLTSALLGGWLSTTTQLLTSSDIIPLATLLPTNQNTLHGLGDKLNFVAKGNYSQVFSIVHTISVLYCSCTAATPPACPLHWIKPERNIGISPLSAPPLCSLSFCMSAGNSTALSTSLLNGAQSIAYPPDTFTLQGCNLLSQRTEKYHSKNTKFNVKELLSKFEVQSASNSSTKDNGHNEIVHVPPQSSPTLTSFGSKWTDTHSHSTVLAPLPPCVQARLAKTSRNKLAGSSSLSVSLDEDQFLTSNSDPELVRVQTSPNINVKVQSSDCSSKGDVEAPPVSKTEQEVSKLCIVDVDLDDPRRRERIERYKEERRLFLREKFRSESFRVGDKPVLQVEIKVSAASTVEEDRRDQRRKTAAELNLNVEQGSQSYYIRDMTALFENRDGSNTVIPSHSQQGKQQNYRAASRQCYIKKHIVTWIYTVCRAETNSSTSYLFPTDEDTHPTEKGQFSEFGMHEHEVLSALGTTSQVPSVLKMSQNLSASWEECCLMWNSGMMQGPFLIEGLGCLPGLVKILWHLQYHLLAGVSLASANPSWDHSQTPEKVKNHWNLQNYLPLPTLQNMQNYLLPQAASLLTGSQTPWAELPLSPALVVLLLLAEKSYGFPISSDTDGTLVDPHAADGHDLAHPVQCTAIGLREQSPSLLSTWARVKNYVATQHHLAKTDKHGRLWQPVLPLLGYLALNCGEFLSMQSSGISSSATLLVSCGSSYWVLCIKIAA